MTASEGTGPSPPSTVEGSVRELREELLAVMRHSKDPDLRAWAWALLDICEGEEPEELINELLRRLNVDPEESP